MTPYGGFYPLVMTNIAMDNGPFIDGLPGLPIKNGGSFHGKLLVITRWYHKNDAYFPYIRHKIVSLCILRIWIPFLISHDVPTSQFYPSSTSPQRWWNFPRISLHDYPITIPILVSENGSLSKPVKWGGLETLIKNKRHVPMSHSTV